MAGGTWVHTISCEACQRLRASWECRSPSGSRKNTNKCTGVPPSTATPSSTKKHPNRFPLPPFTLPLSFPLLYYRSLPHLLPSFNQNHPLIQLKENRNSTTVPGMEQCSLQLDFSDTQSVRTPTPPIASTTRRGRPFVHTCFPSIAIKKSTTTS